MGTVGLFFAPLAPLVAVAAAVVFWVSSWVYKYQLMFVFVSRVETGGVSYIPSDSDSPAEYPAAHVERRYQPLIVLCGSDAIATTSQYVQDA